MKLMSEAIHFIRYSVGNGSGVYICQDNWHFLSPLKNKFGSRIIYDTTSKENARMSNYVGNAGWINLRAISNDLILINDTRVSYQPRVDGEDYIE